MVLLLCIAAMATHAVWAVTRSGRQVKAPTRYEPIEVPVDDFDDDSDDSEDLCESGDNDSISSEEEDQDYVPGMVEYDSDDDISSEYDEEDEEDEYEYEDEEEDESTQSDYETDDEIREPMDCKSTAQSTSG